MSTINQRVFDISAVKTRLKNHPMCGKFEDDGAAFIVYYPAGEWGVVYSGVRASYRDGKLKALEMLEERMERDWKRSFPAAESDYVGN
jgi:hypothetical protein